MNKNKVKCGFRISDFGLLARRSHSNPRSSIRNGSDRRGILLLVVLSLLVLFLLVGTSYVVSSNHYRRANKTLGKPYEPAKSPLQHTDLLEEVVNQLVRDTTNQYSALRYHSLLRDLYGEDGFQIGPTSPDGIRFVDRDDFEYINSAGDPIETSVLDDQLRNLTGDQFFWAAVELDRANPQLITHSNYYNGRVFTLMDGPAAGRSARVVRYDYRVGTLGVDYGVFYLTFIDSDRHFSSTVLDIQQTHAAVINGQPFNGMGVGYNPGVTVGAKLSAEEDVFDIAADMFLRRPIALMPNSALFFPELVLPFSGDPNDFFLSQKEQLQLTQREKERRVAMRGFAGLGGSDESYDAADFQNNALALSPVSPVETVLFDLTAPLPPSLGNIVLPSFHRPALLNYWEAQLMASGSELDGEPNLLRKVMMRPSWFDHPNFTGSNPDLADTVAAFRTALAANDTPNIEANSHDLLLRMIYGPWDVDNDGDGRRDSVWVPFGAPVMMGPQGKLVQPLVAILCVDMDGRLNLNAHGTQHLAGFGSSNPRMPIAGGRDSGNLPEGQGYGPAEISLEPVLSITHPPSTSNNATQFDELLFGGTIYDDPNDNTSLSRMWSGRYGSLNQEPIPAPGFTKTLTDPNTGYDLLAQLKQQGLPRWANRLGNYATPPDFKGRYAVAINDLGQPIYEAFNHIGNVNNQLDLDSPYELDLSRVGANAAGDRAKDGPFSLAELERVLRAYDGDAGKLPPRLWELANRFRTADPNNPYGFDDKELNEWRALLTTDSFDLPVPNVVTPEWMRLGEDRIVDTDPNSVMANDFENVMGQTVAGVHVPRIAANLSVSDLFEYRIRIGLSRRPTPLGGMAPKHVDSADVQVVMKQLMAPELVDGLRIDLNRPFGNGRDDDNDGVVDEPGEVETASGVEAPYWRVDPRVDAQGAAADTTAFTGVDGRIRDNIDRNGDGTIDPWERGDTNGGGLSPEELVNLHNFRRQLLARHLYVLAMTLVDPVPPPAVSSPPTSIERKRLRKYKRTQEDRRLRLAQWAINVVDFRDPDNIMTAFEYDANPFDGWEVDGDLGTVDPNARDFSKDSIDNDGDLLIDKDDPDEIAERLFVWGTERPELVITETLGWHDRSTENHADEDPANDEDFDGDINDDDQGTVPRFASDSTKIPDSDYDQRLRPQGAAFVELYCPWPADTAANTDVHRVNNSGRDLGVDLARTHTGVPSTGSPVWRLMMYKDGGPGMDPDNFFNEDFRPKMPDRSVYFSGFDPAYPDMVSDPSLNNETRYVDDGVAFFNDDTTNRVPQVRPGRYMVVGSGEDQGGGSYLSAIGQRNNSPTGANRGILLVPNLDPNSTATNAAVLQNESSGIIMDLAGFQNAAVSNTTSVAIIDQAMRPDPADPSPLRPRLPLQQKRSRFTFSEPAGGYPNRIEGSRWNGQQYVPILDVPLDDQRQLFGQGKGLGGWRGRRYGTKAQAGNNAQRWRNPAHAARPRWRRRRTRRRTPQGWPTRSKSRAGWPYDTRLQVGLLTTAGEPVAAVESRTAAAKRYRDSRLPGWSGRQPIFDDRLDGRQRHHVYRLISGGEAQKSAYRFEGSDRDLQ